MIEKIAFYQKRTDEKPNIELAAQIAKDKNSKGIEEMIRGLDHKEKQVNNDCIKVLYEVGYLNPELINPYITVFLEKLHSRNNRIIWGCCIALSLITESNSDIVYKNIDLIKGIFQNGSVITSDYCIRIFAGIAKGNDKYSKEIIPILINHLENCGPKEVAQHAERASLCINEENRGIFIEALNTRLASLSDSQKNRVKKLLKKIEEK